MDEYKKPYLILWGGCTEALEALEHQNYGQARELLIKAQQEAEEQFLEAEEE